MIDVSNETKQAFLTDSSDKQLSIEFDNGVNSTEEINYFTGSTKFFDTYSYANISEDRTYDQWDMFYFYPEESTSYTGNLQGSINEEKSHQYSNLYISIDAKYVDAGVTNGTADIEYTGPIWLSVYYVENGENKTKHISFTDTNIINEFLSQDGTRLHAALYDFITARFFDANNYIKNIRIYFRVKYSNVTIDSGYSSISHAYDIVFDNLMINLSNTPSPSFEYPPYSKSQIINGVYPILNLHNEDLVGESFTLTESICSQDNIKFGLCESSNCSFDIINRTDKFNDLWFKVFITCNNTEKVPLGRFKIKNVKKQTKNNMRITKITAYDEMADWDRDVSDWYSTYIFALEQQLPRNNYEFKRQMFSTYYNFARMLGYEDDNNYEDTLVYSCLSSELQSHNTDNSYVYDTNGSVELTNQDYYYGYKYKFEISNVSTDFLYKFDKINGGDFPVGTSDDVIMQDSFFDGQIKKGYLTNGSIMVVEELDPDLPHPEGHSQVYITERKYLVNAGDYFAISDNCVKLTFYYGCKLFKFNSSGSQVIYKNIIDSVYVYKTPCPSWIKNLICRSLPLVYHDSSSVNGEMLTPANCTVRDVFRSLFEINGAFIRVNRYGNLETLYPTKNALYPSETLYPSEELYPRKGTTIIPMSRYISSEIEDFESADFGKLQLSSSNPNENATTLVTYPGNPSLNSTYIIEDNVFMANQSSSYFKSPEGFTNVEFLLTLSLIFSKIENLGYTPHTTKLRGLPWVEIGDRLTLMTNNSGFETFIFRRTLKGIQALRDTYEAKGDDIIESYPDDKILEY